MTPPHGQCSDPVDAMRQALADHEEKDQSRHIETLQGQAALKGSIETLTAVIENEHKHLVKRLDAHHLSLYGDGSDKIPGLVARQDRADQRVKWRNGLIAAVFTVSGALAATIASTALDLYDRFVK